MSEIVRPARLEDGLVRSIFWTRARAVLIERGIGRYKRLIVQTT